jgi:predicted TIM-barrel fold metal-dependent hydrolase
MPFIPYTPDCESCCPHAADLLEREIAEDGFSAGWCMQAKPVASHWFDIHIHGLAAPGTNILEKITPDLEAAKHLGVTGALMLTELHGKKWRRNPSEVGVMVQFPTFTIEEAAVAMKDLVASGNHSWAAYLHYKNPDPDLLREAYKAGARAVKLHNAPQIEDAAPADLWLSKDWQDTFRVMGELKLPVVWHVTQRLPSSNYTGGGRNTYWKKGWENGIAYGNEELLQVFLRCCERHPDVPFIGAHQLHIGWERLDELFTGCQNLYVDSTCGCILHPYDTFYPEDKKYLRAIFIKWAGRILYGTDNFWGGGGGPGGGAGQVEHMRFVQHLDLPEDALQKIAHQNAERLLGLACPF